MQLYAAMVLIQTQQCARERNEAKWLGQRETVEYHFPKIPPLIVPHVL